MNNGIACMMSCQRIQYCRGLCTNCYQKYAKMVKKGLTTWEELESQGKAVAGKPRVGFKLRNPI